MATSPRIFITGRRREKLAALKQCPVLFPPAYKNSRRHQGQERQRPNRWCACPIRLLFFAVAVACCRLLRSASCRVPTTEFALRWWGRSCPRWRLEFLLQGGKRGEACLSEASLPPLPPCDINSRNLSPSRARISLLTFFGQDQRK